jgi:phosphatidylglycerophosphate synthase
MASLWCTDLLRRLPWALVLSRLLLAPLMVGLALAFGRDAGAWLAMLVVLGVLTDVYDGIIARALGVATTGLRRLDSQADLAFWLAALWCCWHLHPDAVWAEASALALLLALEATIYLIAWRRFGRELSSHAWSAKLWGLALTLALARLLAGGGTGWSFDLMLLVGLAAQLDVIAIALLLPVWEHDVPSAWHAWQRRRGRPFRRRKLLN